MVIAGAVGREIKEWQRRRHARKRAEDERQQREYERQQREYERQRQEYEAARPNWTDFALRMKSAESSG